ncbi:unnamed protein product, partial [marine sediment metagenome]
DTWQKEFNEIIDGVNFEHFSQEIKQLIVQERKETITQYKKGLVKSLGEMRRKIQITGEEIDCVTCGKCIISNMCQCDGFNEALDEIIKICQKDTEA